MDDETYDEDSDRQAGEGPGTAPHDEALGLVSAPSIVHSKKRRRDNNFAHQLDAYNSSKLTRSPATSMVSSAAQRERAYQSAASPSSQARPASKIRGSLSSIPPTGQQLGAACKLPTRAGKLLNGPSAGGLALSELQEEVLHDDDLVSNKGKNPRRVGGEIGQESVADKLSEVKESSDIKKVGRKTGGDPVAAKSTDANNEVATGGFQGLLDLSSVPINPTGDIYQDQFGNIIQLGDINAEFAAE